MMLRSMVLAAAALLGLAASAPAQQAGVPAGAGPAAERAVLVALVPSLPSDAARAVVVRRGAPDPSDVIVLRDEGATADDLAAAISWLLSSRASAGDAFANIRRVTITNARADRDLAPGLRRSLEEAIARARRGEVRTVPTVGAARVAMLSLERFRRG